LPVVQAIIGGAGMTKSDNLHALELHRRRLEHLVGELLRTADDVDQASKFAEQPLTEDWQKRLGNTCTELASLSEAVHAIRSLLDAGDTGAAQRALLKSTDIATRLSERLKNIKHSSRWRTKNTGTDVS
jgi:hypothetical protein